MNCAATFEPVYGWDHGTLHIFCPVVGQPRSTTAATTSHHDPARPHTFNSCELCKDVA